MFSYGRFGENMARIYKQYFSAERDWVDVLDFFLRIAYPAFLAGRSKALWKVKLFFHHCSSCW